MVLAFQIIAGFFISFFFANITERAILKWGINKQLKKLSKADQETHKAIVAAELRVRGERALLSVQSCAFDVIKFLTTETKKTIRDEFSRESIEYGFINSRFARELQYVDKIYDSKRYNKRARNGFDFFSIAVSHAQKTPEFLQKRDIRTSLAEHLTKIGFIRDTDSNGGECFKDVSNVTDVNFLWGEITLTLWLSTDKSKIQRATIQLGFPWQAFVYYGKPEANGEFNWSLEMDSEFMHQEAEDATVRLAETKMKISDWRKKYQESKVEEMM